MNRQAGKESVVGLGIWLDVPPLFDLSIGVFECLNSSAVSGGDEDPLPILAESQAIPSLGHRKMLKQFGPAISTTARP